MLNENKILNASYSYPEKKTSPIPTLVASLTSPDQENTQATDYWKLKKFMLCPAPAALVLE